MRDELTGLPTLMDVLSKLKDRIEKEKEVNILFLQIIESSLYEEEFGFDVFDTWIKGMADYLKSFIDKEFSPFENPLIFVSEPFSSLICIAFPSSHPTKKLKEILRTEISKQIPAPFEITVKKISYDPLKRTERSIYEMINNVKLEHLKAETRMRINIKSLFRRILKKGEIRMVYQPIYRITDGKIIYGYEALARGPKGTELEMPTALFTVADELDELENLENLCRWKALLTSKKLSNEEKKIFINVSSKILQLKESGFIKGLFENINELQINCEKIVIELTERHEIRDFKSLKSNIKKLKDKGIEISIDDVGVGYTSLQTLAELSPNYLKYDMVLVRNIHKDLVKQNLLEMVLNFGDKINAPVIAEGVEKEEELETIKKIGVKYAQGFLLSQPIEVEI